MRTGKGLRTPRAERRGQDNLMNLITGLYRPTSGTVRVLGLDPVRDAR